MKFYNIRVVEADSLEEAWNQVEECNFEELHDMCDEVYTLEELKIYLSYE